MPFTLLVIHECPTCTSQVTYHKYDTCDHESFHALGSNFELSATPCVNCKEAKEHLDLKEMANEDIIVWFSPRKMCVAPNEAVYRQIEREENVQN